MLKDNLEYIIMQVFCNFIEDKITLLLIYINLSMLELSYQFQNLHAMMIPNTARYNVKNVATLQEVVTKKSVSQSIQLLYEISQVSCIMKDRPASGEKILYKLHIIKENLHQKIQTSILEKQPRNSHISQFPCVPFEAVVYGQT